MSEYIVEIQIDEQFKEGVSSEPLHLAVLATLRHQQIVGGCELSVVVTDDEALHALNLRHRDVDGPTDVLAFADEASESFVSAPGQSRYLGDVVISFPRAQAQAGEADHSIQAELQLLAVHGVLHLLGYDDLVEEKRARMWAVQAEILRGLEIEINLPV
jgi:probable rRNA maturation factor